MPREKTFKRVYTFHTTTDAMAFENYCRGKGVPGRLIPVPGEISAGCGMCWVAGIGDGEAVDSAIESGGLRIQGAYILLL